MGKTFKYKRDLPDGSSQISDGIFQKPEGIFKYYDDIVSIRETEEDASPIVVYQFGKEQSYPERSLVGRVPNCYILHYITDGEGTYNGESHARRGFLSAGDSAQHEIGHRKSLALLGSLWRGVYKRLMKELGLDEDNLFRIFLFRQARGDFDDTIYKPHDDCDPDLYHGYLYIILSYHVEEIQRRDNIERKAHRVKYMEFIDENYAQNLSIEQLALDMHISPAISLRIFKNIRDVNKGISAFKKSRGGVGTLRTTDSSAGNRGAGGVFGLYPASLFKNRKNLSNSIPAAKTCLIIAEFYKR